MRKPINATSFLGHSGHHLVLAAGSVWEVHSSDCGGRTHWVSILCAHVCDQFESPVSINTSRHSLGTFPVVISSPLFFSLSCSLSAPSLPPFSRSQDLLLPAFALAVVGFGFTASLGTMFSLKHGYSIDSNQVARGPPRATPTPRSTSGV